MELGAPSGEQAKAKIGPDGSNIQELKFQAVAQLLQPRPSDDAVAAAQQPRRNVVQHLVHQIGLEQGRGQGWAAFGMHFVHTPFSQVLAERIEIDLPVVPWQCDGLEIR